MPGRIDSLVQGESFPYALFVYMRYLKEAFMNDIETNLPTILQSPKNQRRITKNLNSQRGVTFKPKIPSTSPRDKFYDTYNTYNTFRLRKPTKISKNYSAS
jgi:hypothetical protein